MRSRDWARSVRRRVRRRLHTRRCADRGIESEPCELSCLLVGKAQHKLAILDVNRDLAAGCELAEQNLFGERRFDLRLNEPRHWTRAELSIKSVLGEPRACRLGQTHARFLFKQLCVQLTDELINHALDHCKAQRLKRDPRIEPIAKLRAE